MATEPKLKQQYHHGNLRDALLEAAIELLQTQNIEKLTLNNLSKAVGVTRSAAYRHFHNKNDILVHLAIQGFQSLTQKMHAAIHSDAPCFSKAFLACGLEYIQFALDNPIHFKLMFDSKTTYPDNHNQLSQCVNEAYETLLTVVKNYVAQHQHNDEHDLMALSAWSAVHGYATLAINHKLIEKNKDALMSQAEIMLKQLFSF